MDQEPTRDAAASPTPVATPPPAGAPVAGAPLIVDAAPASASKGPAPSAAASRSGGGRLLNIALAVAVVAAIGGVAFAAGRMTAPVAAAGTFPGAGNFPGGQGFTGNGTNRPGNGQGPGAFGNGGLSIEGTVESKTDTTLTLKTADGRTIQVALDGSTAYHSQTDASATDVTTGGTVRVQLDFSGARPAASGSPAGLTARDVTVVP